VAALLLRRVATPLKAAGRGAPLPHGAAAPSEVARCAPRRGPPAPVCRAGAAGQRGRRASMPAQIRNTTAMGSEGVAARGGRAERGRRWQGRRGSVGKVGCRGRLWGGSGGVVGLRRRRLFRRWKREGDSGSEEKPLDRARTRQASNGWRTDRAADRTARAGLWWKREETWEASSGRALIGWPGDAGCR
jgi:hypothetical protein